MQQKMSFTPFSLTSMGPGRHAMLLIAIDHLFPLERLFGDAVVNDVVRESYRRLADICPRVASLWQPHPRRFAITVPGMAEDGARELAASIQAALSREPINTANGETTITASVGCAVASNTSLEKLGTAARDALIDAMNAGNSSIRIARSDREVEMQRARVLTTAQAALSALGAGHLSLVYQPVVSSLGDRNICFHECLARHVQEDGQVFSAREFLPRVERLGLCEMLDRQVLVLALDKLSKDPSARLAINLFPSAFRDRDWMELLRNAMRDCEDVADRLIVEIREPDMHTDLGQIRKFLNTLREAGTCLGLADFGARRSTLSQLADLRFDMVKLDRRLTDGIAALPENQLMIDTLVVKASRFEMMVVAEGVESAEDAHTLSQLGVGYLQGYLFGKESAVLEPRQEPDRTLGLTA
ncbi:MAG: GGDEF domain-containing protein [Pseudomonadota bacterium]